MRLLYNVVGATCELDWLSNTIFDPISPNSKPFSMPLHCTQISILLSLPNFYQVKHIKLISFSLTSVTFQSYPEQSQDVVIPFPPPEINQSLSFMTQNILLTFSGPGQILHLQFTGFYDKPKQSTHKSMNLQINSPKGPILLDGKNQPFFRKQQVDNILNELGLLNDIGAGELEGVLQELQSKVQNKIDQEDFVGLDLMAIDVKYIRELGNEIQQKRQIIQIWVKQERYQLCEEIYNEIKKLTEESIQIQKKYKIGQFSYDELPIENNMDLKTKLNNFICNQLKTTQINTLYDEQIDDLAFGPIFTKTFFSFDNTLHILAISAIIQFLSDCPLNDSQRNNLIILVLHSTSLKFQEKHPIMNLLPMITDYFEAPLPKSLYQSLISLLPQSKDYLVVLLIKDEENINLVINNGDIMNELIIKKDIRNWDEKVKNKQSKWTMQQKNIWDQQILKWDKQNQIQNSINDQQIQVNSNSQNDISSVRLNIQENAQISYDSKQNSNKKTATIKNNESRINLKTSNQNKNSLAKNIGKEETNVQESQKSKGFCDIF